MKLQDTNNDGMMRKKLVQLLYWFIAIALIIAGAIGATGRFWGHEIGASQTTSAQEVLMRINEHTTEINTTTLCPDVIGYKGTTPLRIVVTDGIIDTIEALPNIETPSFMRRAMKLTSPLIGQPIDNVSDTEIDVISGATYSSKAIISNIQEGLAYANEQGLRGGGWLANIDFSAKALVVLFVALMAAVVPFFVKAKWYRITQWLLNAGVLGFWTGTFVSYSCMVGIISNGTAALTSLALILMLVVAFIFPLFGKKQHYCTFMCPLGSAQQLMGLLTKRKITIGVKVGKVLTWFRRLLWAVLMLCLWIGFFVEWTDYELFSAFLVQSASWVILVCAGLTLVLSVFITRPYCRYICPTGTLLKLSEGQRIK